MSLPEFETLSEWPAVTVVTPSANIFLAPFETVSEWPGLDLAYDQNLVLPPFETLSEWPALDVQVPILPGDAITGNYQIEYNAGASTLVNAYTAASPGTSGAHGPF
ncbi:hypothetical protein ACQEUU_37510 [Nonomuraea sp. CA-218870]|uniref:hypothetical protein n=1 Tax=Nonomuraea sp. CA-218870 TaxID=3239998 RepID=UPI003D90F9C3